MGIDASEFDAPGGPGRVHLYRGVGGSSFAGIVAGDCSGTSCPLWDSPASLDAYDLLLLGCEGDANLQTKSAAAFQSMHDWLLKGGTLFGVHSQDAWLSHGPADLQSLATWVDGGASGAPGPFRINAVFPRALTLRQWGTATGVVDADGGIALAPGDVATSVSAVTGPAVAWIFDESTAQLDGSTPAGNVKALSIALPYPIDGGPVPQACGRATLTDIHPGGAAVISSVPSGCPAGGLSAEEKVLEFLLFNEFALRYPICSGCPPPPPPPPLPPPDAGND
jgi:hypothetical protein